MRGDDFEWDNCPCCTHNKIYAGNLELNFEFAVIRSRQRRESLQGILRERNQKIYELDRAVADRDKAEQENFKFREGLDWLLKLTAAWSGQPFGSPGHDIAFLEMHEKIRRILEL